jgi:hypothetical protein
VTVIATGELEPFHTFWKEVASQDELIPTSSCSVPTFHGPVADLAAVAATLTSMVGAHLARAVPISGIHLVDLPHSPVGSYRRLIPAGSLPRHKMLEYLASRSQLPFVGGLWRRALQLPLECVSRSARSCGYQCSDVHGR